MVERAFEKTGADPGHERVLKVYSNQIEERTFSSWLIGVNKLDESLQDSSEEYIDFLAHPDVDYLTENPDRI